MLLGVSRQNLANINDGAEPLTMFVAEKELYNRPIYGNVFQTEPVNPQGHRAAFIRAGKPAFNGADCGGKLAIFRFSEIEPKRFSPKADALRQAAKNGIP
jgi:hypothetical protein